MDDEQSKPCKCGHYQNVHLLANSYMRAVCLKCDPYRRDETNPFFSVHDFQLDNLKYIEDLAKERNLV